MSDILWCVDHERFELAQASQLGIVHEYVIRTEFGVETDWCFFDLGWTYCSPPEEYPDWDLDFVEPYEDEDVEVI